MKSGGGEERSCKVLQAISDFITEDGWKFCQDYRFYNTAMLKTHLLEKTYFNDTGEMMGPKNKMMGLMINEKITVLL